MHLLRIQVPEFRALKKIDINFDKDFTPKVFPLGSENGGGKSTLLQLIFVLLHCTQNPERLSFVENMLAHFSIPSEASHKLLAKIDIWNGEKTVQVEFLCCNETYLHGDSFSILTRKKLVKEQLDSIRNDFAILKEKLENRGGILSVLLEQRNEAQFDERNEFRKTLKKLEETEEEYAKLSSVAEKIWESLRAKKLIYITTYNGTTLLCRIADLEVGEASFFLSQLSKKVFMAAPSTQVYLFLPLESQKRLFTARYKTEFYESALEEAKSKLPGFFTYDFLSTDIIVESLKTARDRDFEEAVTTGQYGSHYKQLSNEMNQLLAVGKQIVPQFRSQGDDITQSDPLEGIVFKTKQGEILYPEALSHGELKRLSLYVWIKYRRIEEAIVLMDEIENAFHPDWQYQMVSDLKEWGPNNQYILATHSYELCQAVTPAHVNDLGI